MMLVARIDGWIATDVTYLMKKEKKEDHLKKL